MKITAEHNRLIEYRKRKLNWKKWGPYLSERSWGTVREDYSEDGNAWDFLPHDHARSTDGTLLGADFRGERFLQFPDGLVQLELFRHRSPSVDLLESTEHPVDRAVRKIERAPYSARTAQSTESSRAAR